MMVCDGITTVMVCNGILIYDVYRTSHIVTINLLVPRQKCYHGISCLKHNEEIIQTFGNFLKKLKFQWNK